MREGTQLVSQKGADCQGLVVKYDIGLQFHSMWNDKGLLILNKIDKVIDMVDKFSLTNNKGGCLSQYQMK